MEVRQLKSPQDCRKQRVFMEMNQRSATAELNQLEPHIKTGLKLRCSFTHVCSSQWTSGQKCLLVSHTHSLTLGGHRSTNMERTSIIHFSELNDLDLHLGSEYIYFIKHRSV